MTLTSSKLVLVATLASVALALGGCPKKEKAPQADAMAEVKTEEPATPTPTGEFSVESVPVTTANLPPPPFFTAPEGLESVFADKDKVINFGQQIFLFGNGTKIVEGKIWREAYPLDRERKYTALEFQRNYENAITALGGVKVNRTQWTYPLIDAAGKGPAIDKMNYSGPIAPDYPHDSYLIRTADKEYWIDVSVGSFPSHGYVVVLEKQTMKQSVGFLDATAMKQAIDAKGRVALQINFDLDKATIRPDAQPTLAEIAKLLELDPALKLSIDGHTDSSGDSAHNRSLSTARARSVLGALVGLGIDPVRLKSRGFGPDKPVADNATDAGRAKNRRVELVKI